jgi:hypothetical protein
MWWEALRQYFVVTIRVTGTKYDLNIYFSFFLILMGLSLIIRVLPKKGNLKGES